VWALVMDKGGSKMVAHDPGDKDYPPIGLQPVRDNDGGVCFELQGRNVTMSYLAFMLSRNLNRGVIDRTGLPARYDVKLQFMPDGMQPRRADGGAVAISPDCSDIFFALPKQLGMRLESGKGPVEFLVVEQAEKPAEN
jgi:uncharacterized protein (TIGR03435 family)